MIGTVCQRNVQQEPHYSGSLVEWREKGAGTNGRNGRKVASHSWYLTPYSRARNTLTL